MGTDEPLYDGDTELTAGMQKSSKSPFDMLSGEVTANLADLWCKYALATKKNPCFTFSQGLQKEVDIYFAMKTSSVALEELPEEKLVGCISPENYQWLHRRFQTGNLLLKAAEGYEVLKKWLKENFNMDLVETNSDDILSDAKVVDLSEGLPLTVTDSELGSENLEINFGKFSVYSGVVSFSKAGACGSSLTKRAKKHLIFVAGNNKNKSPPKFNERSEINGRQGYDSS